MLKGKRVNYIRLCAFFEVFPFFFRKIADHSSKFAICSSGNCVHSFHGLFQSFPFLHKAGR